MILISISLLFGIGISAYATESDNIPTEGYIEGEKTDPGVEKSEDTELLPEEGGDYTQNIFEEIYNLLEKNADKIFSILAFIGTLVVGVGYKSGLLPLLREALAKLKSSIDGVKANSDEREAITSQKLKEIGSAVERIEAQLAIVENERVDYTELYRDRESMRVILAGQIDMLYAIFMSSALPQYQKDEIGERISEMREELISYESDEEI